MSPSTVYPTADGQKFAGDTQLVVVTCNQCHIAYAIPNSLNDAALRWRGDRADGRGWKLCCPMGHTWWYIGESKQARLERQLEIERQRSGRLAAERDQERAHARAQKARGTRFKNERDRLKTRAANGVCPCCNRTFQQLARHMKAKHPDFEATA